MKKGHARIRLFSLALGILVSQACVHEDAGHVRAPASAARQDYMFIAEPSTIVPGESVTLRWQIPGATKVTIEAVGVSGKEPLHSVGIFGGTGEAEVRPLADTTYVITCEGSTTITCASLSVHVRLKQF